MSTNVKLLAYNHCPIILYGKTDKTGVLAKLGNETICVTYTPDNMTSSKLCIIAEDEPIHSLKIDEKILTINNSLINGRSWWSGDSSASLFWYGLTYGWLYLRDSLPKNVSFIQNADGTFDGDTFWYSGERLAPIQTSIQFEAGKANKDNDKNALTLTSNPDRILWEQSTPGTLFCGKYLPKGKAKKTRYIGVFKYEIDFDGKTYTCTEKGGYHNIGETDYPIEIWNFMLRGTNYSYSISGISYTFPATDLPREPGGSYTVTSSDSTQESITITNKGIAINMVSTIKGYVAAVNLLR